MSKKMIFCLIVVISMSLPSQGAHSDDLANSSDKRTEIANDLKVPPPKGDILVGAYYFGAWYQKPIPHFQPGTHTYIDGRPVKDWREFYPEREPVTGWFDDTQDALSQEILLAAKGGIDFFVFDWYPDRDIPWFPGSREGINSGLKYFLSSPNKTRMKFALLYTNSSNHEITTAAEWDLVVNKWIGMFQDTQYLKIEGKPIFLIISAGGMRKQWKDSEGVQKALAILRSRAKTAGFPGILIGGGLPDPGPNGNFVKNLQRDGYDFFSNYNDCLQQVHGTRPYDEILSQEPRWWKSFLLPNSLPFIPVVTSSWDRRPNMAPTSPHFVYLKENTPEKFKKLLKKAKDAVDRKLQHRVPTSNGGRKMVLLYAWNELGEGGILIPTKEKGDAYLKQVGAVFGTEYRPPATEKN